MKPHPIVLREPWTRTRTDTGILHKRQFHAPTGIDAGETVWIVIEKQAYPAQLHCNGKACGDFLGSGEFNITALLVPYNELKIFVLNTDSEETENRLGEVRLEIRPAQRG